MKAIAIEKEKQKLLKKKNQSQNIASAKKLLGPMNVEDDLTKIIVKSHWMS